MYVPRSGSFYSQPLVTLNSCPDCDISWSNQSGNLGIGLYIAAFRANIPRPLGSKDFFFTFKHSRTSKMSLAILKETIGSTTLSRPRNEN